MTEAAWTSTWDLVENVRPPNTTAMESGLVRVNRAHDASGNLGCNLTSLRVVFFDSH